MSQVMPHRPTEAEQLERFRTLRDTDPVTYDAKAKMWSVYRYEDVATVLADHATFSSHLGEVVKEADELIEGNILQLDPPRHNRLRSLVSKAFTPAAIGRMEGRIAELTEELLDEMGGRTRLELVADLAYPLPVIVIADMLGVPSEDRPKFKEWADALLSRENMDGSDKERMARAKRQLEKFYDYLGEHVADRRRQPREDLLTNLVRAEIDGERLGDKEIVGFATVLLLAGHITTTALLGNAIRCLDENPEAQGALRADPTKIPAAVEEVLRYRSPFAMTVRVTARETTLGGKTIPARQMVMVSLLSANHDERQFENAEDFVIGREPNAHVGFGKGVHFCLGAPLARLESRVALGILLRRYASIQVDRSYPIEPYENPGFNSLRHLHLVVEPA